MKKYALLLIITVLIAIIISNCMAQPGDPTGDPDIIVPAKIECDSIVVYHKGEVILMLKK